MAVQKIDHNFGVNGHATAIKDFKRAHEENTAGLLNAFEGKEVDAPRPVHDPTHPDNQWPRMAHHPAKGEMPVGTNLKGVDDPSKRKAIQAANEKVWKDAMASGYRAEPYLRPQVALHDPATEKKITADELARLRGENAILSERLNQLLERFDAQGKTS